MTSRHLLGRIAGGILLLALAGCARTDVQSQQNSSGGRLPRPDVVVIDDFAVVASDVKLDRGLLHRAERLVGGGNASAQQETTARKVAAAVSMALVEEVRKLGFPAARAYAGAPAAGGAHVIVTGQFLSVDEGNQTRRNLIGLGAGSSKVEADAQFSYQAAGTPPRRLESLTVITQSSRKPGAAVALGAGASAAVVGATGVASEVLATDVDALAEKMAAEIGRKLAALFRQQGWIVAR